MFRLLIVFFGLFVLVDCHSQSKLPPCPKDQNQIWTDCFGSSTFEKSGSACVGEWLKNMRHGVGIATYPNGEKYIGEWSNGNYHGIGTRYDKNGAVAESGYFEDNRLRRSDPSDPAEPSPPQKKTETGGQLSEKTIIGGNWQRKFYWEDVSLKPCKANLSKHDRCMYQQNSLPFVGEHEDGTNNGFGIYRELTVQVGFFKGLGLHGTGIEYDLKGNVIKSGRFQRDRLVESFPLNPAEYPFDLEARAKDGLVIFFSQKFANFRNKTKFSNNIKWHEIISKRVSNDLLKWIAESGGEIPSEVELPSFPPALKLTQERWESDTEFDTRVAAARRARQAEIDRIQVEYKNKVDARNRQIVVLQKRRSELERTLPTKKLEIIEAALKTEAIPLKVASTDFDSKRAVLFANISIDGRDPETFEYKDSPIDLRRTALTTPEKLELKPVFYISETGEFGLRSILVQADKLESTGTPTSASAQRQTPLTATISVPAPSTLIAQQSALAVDRNQVEQILYREENEALRKRLDEQRRAQELALAEQTTRVSAETSRLKAQAEAALQRQKELEQQIASTSTPPPASLAMGKRIALVIGNAKYNARPLQNPVNDADDVSKALKGSGFDVLDLRNASLREMTEGARTFGDMLKTHDVGLVYYSGHGIEVKGRNYFIPVNADIKREDEVAFQSLDVGLILEKMATANKSVNIMIVDACRDDPFGRSFRSSSSGLAAVDAPKGSLIAFATSPGKVAADGDGRNSPYTKHLVRAMQQPNKKIEEVFKEVRRAVQAETKDQQTPWENTSLSGDFYFRVQK
jgi:hypothetical protein